MTHSTGRAPPCGSASPRPTGACDERRTLAAPHPAQEHRRAPRPGGDPGVPRPRAGSLFTGGPRHGRRHEERARARRGAPRGRPRHLSDRVPQSGRTKAPGDDRHPRTVPPEEKRPGSDALQPGHRGDHLPALRRRHPAHRRDPVDRGIRPGDGLRSLPVDGAPRANSPRGRSPPEPRSLKARMGLSRSSAHPGR